MRKFSESLDNEIDATYIRQCFADFFDSGSASMESKSSAEGTFYNSNQVEMKISIHKIKTVFSEVGFPRKIGANWVNNTNCISLAADDLIKNSESLKEIESSLNRIADEYPNYSYKIWTNGFPASEVLINIWS